MNDWRRISTLLPALRSVPCEVRAHGGIDYLRALGTSLVLGSAATGFSRTHRFCISFSFHLFGFGSNGSPVCHANPATAWLSKFRSACLYFVATVAPS